MVQRSKFLNHYCWLEKNYERFCKNSGYKYYCGDATAHGDKLSRLKTRCDEVGRPFYKVAAIALATWYNKPPHSAGIYAFEDKCIALYDWYPEWFEGCGGEEDCHSEVLSTL